jgi:hypothetical protein
MYSTLIVDAVDDWREVVGEVVERFECYRIDSHELKRFHEAFGFFIVVLIFHAGLSIR